MKTEDEIKAQIAKLEQERDQFVTASNAAIQMLKWIIAPAPVTQEAKDALSV